jgi:hypothetical protein
MLADKRRDIVDLGINHDPTGFPAVVLSDLSTAQFNLHTSRRHYIPNIIRNTNVRKKDIVCNMQLLILATCPSHPIM